MAAVVLAFLAYALLGWVLESVVFVWCERRFGNPGFLTGPVVPIYGVGALAILAPSRDAANPLTVFALAALVATVVEFVTHVLLQRLFGLVLWDYSGRFGNLQGRVCLGNSLAFGAAGVAVVYLVDPALSAVLAGLDPMLAVALASAGLAVLLVDWGHAVAAVLRVRPELDAVRGSLGEARRRIEAELEALGSQVDLELVRRRRALLVRSSRALTRLDAAFPAASRGRLTRLSPRRPTTSRDASAHSHASS